jgi:uroporphyrinogen-III synthase
LQRVLIVRGQDGRDWLAAKCAEKGMHVDFHAAYCRKAATWSSQSLETLRDWASQQGQPVWLLTSTHGIEATVNQLFQAGLLEWALKGRFILTHPRQIAFLSHKIQGLLNVHTASFVAQEQNIRVSSPDQPSILLNFSYFRDN